MEDKHLASHLLKVFSELEYRIAQRVIDVLPELPVASASTTSERLLKDVDVCEQFQISISHFYDLKKKYKDFPTINIGGAKRYKQSALETFFKTINN